MNYKKNELLILLFIFISLIFYESINIYAFNFPTKNHIEKKLEDEKKNNFFSIENLIKIKGIGQKTALKIITYIKENPNFKIDDLINIKGIGSKKLDLIKKHYELFKKN